MHTESQVSREVRMPDSDYGWRAYREVFTTCHGSG